MTTPAGDNAFLQELELNVRSELTVVETSEPEVDADGVPTVEWLLDPDVQRYEVGLHSLLGAVEALEHGSGVGGDPDAAARPLRTEEMTDRTRLLAASFRRSPEDAYSMTVAAGCETAAPGQQGNPAPSRDEAIDDVPVRRPGEIAVTRDSAADIMVRAALPRPDQCRILAMPYPVEHQVFWQVLADLGITQEGLMNRMGASP